MIRLSAPLLLSGINYSKLGSGMIGSGYLMIEAGLAGWLFSLRKEWWPGCTSDRGFSWVFS